MHMRQRQAAVETPPIKRLPDVVLQEPYRPPPLPTLSYFLLYRLERLFQSSDTPRWMTYPFAMEISGQAWGDSVARIPLSWQKRCQLVACSHGGTHLNDHAAQLSSHNHERAPRRPMDSNATTYTRCRLVPVVVSMFLSVGVPRRFSAPRQTTQLA